MPTAAIANASARADNKPATPRLSIVCGGLTGGLYKSTAGIKKCGMGAAFGIGLASLWALVLRKDERVSNYI